MVQTLDMNTVMDGFVVFLNIILWIGLMVLIFFILRKYFKK